jgi:GNAT superfamily N-acetyltransferase
MTEKASPAATRPADAAIVRAWVMGWAISRGAPPPVAFAGGYRVDVGGPAQRVRYVLPHLDDALVRRLTRSVDPRGASIKVCAASEAVGPLLTDHWKLQESCTMMTLRFASSGARVGESLDVPSGYAVNVTRSASLIALTICDGTGALAARGRVAIWGRYGVVDQVVTETGHQRRGLGRFVMQALCRFAWAQGGTAGVLVATADGRGLYEALGWEVHAPYVSAAGIGSRPATWPRNHEAAIAPRVV